MRKIFLALLLVALLPFVETNATVKEKNMDLTVKRLYNDLQYYRENLEYNISQYEKVRSDHWSSLERSMQECQEYTIVLYTQQEDRLFALSQACQNLENLMDRFHRDQHPFEKWKANFESEIDRYKRLQQLLTRIQSSSLTTKGEEARKGCIAICQEIGTRLEELQEEIKSDEEQYENANARIEATATYNTERFEGIRRRVFTSGGDNYFKVLSSLGTRIQNISSQVESDNTATGTSKSVARENRIVVLTGAISLLVCVLLALILVYLCFPRRRFGSGFMGKRPYITASAAMTLFLVVMATASRLYFSKFYIVSSLKTFLEFVLILDIIFTSLTLRIDAEHLGKAIRIYLPVVLMVAIFIVERILLVGNDVVEITLPLLLLFFTAWEILLLVRNRSLSRKSSAKLLWITVAVTSATTVLAWMGFSFLALLITIYWIIQLTSLQAITCLKYLLRMDEVRSADSFRAVWIDPSVKKLVIPIVTIFTFIISFRWAARIFSMSSWAGNIITAPLFTTAEGMSISLSKFLMLAAFAFIFNWFATIIKTALKAIYKENYTTGPIPLYVTLGSIFIWFIYAVIAIKLLGINSKGLIAAVGGMGVGVGFALKDTIEDLFCGISLLMGRVHLSDIIECDGVRGKITDIGIRSTTVETLDGSVISFLNSQLFAKNFKNLTKNHMFELCCVEVGVAYGTDVSKAREVITAAIRPIDAVYSAGKSPVIQFTGFGGSSLDFTIKVWLPTADRTQIMSQMREEIYNALGRNGIEIPFPQTDVHIMYVNK
ncbi:MAG: mechanosensitive ion channel [Bacteroidales bacterium]|nr:mechanosensitive ion channel [Bacteroidales bacterium]